MFPRKINWKSHINAIERLLIFWFVVIIIGIHAVKSELEIEPVQSMLLTEEDLRLECCAYDDNVYSLEWEIPFSVPKEQIEYSLLQSFNDSKTFTSGIRKYLTVKNLTINYSGKYNCVARNAKSYKVTSKDVKIFDRDSIGYINFTNPEKNAYSFVKRKGQNIQWMIDYGSKYHPDSKWSTPLKQFIRDEAEHQFDHNKYELLNKMHGSRRMFKIRNLGSNDFGLYMLITDLGAGKIRFINVTLHEATSPSVAIENGLKSHYVPLDKSFQILCNTSGKPMPIITWNFAMYPNYPSDKDSSLVNPLNYEHVPVSDYIGYSRLNMSTNVSGILTCTACNLVNCNNATTSILLSDDIGRFGIIRLTKLFYPGDDVILTCAGSIHAFQNLSWNETLDKCYGEFGRKKFNIEQRLGKYSILSDLHIENVTKCHQRSYSCLGHTKKGNYENFSYNLSLNIPRKPNFKITHNLDKTKITFDPKSNKNKTWRLNCCADGDPPPNVIWFKDNIRLQESPEHHFSHDNCELTVIVDSSYLKGGRYACKAENRFGKIEDYIDFGIEGDEADNKNLPIVINSLVLVLIVLLIASLVFWKHQQISSKRRLKKTTPQRFDEGAVNYFDPELDIVDQAEMLPYDEKWEYPRELLSLGKIVGSGAFGIVKKARAKSICRGEAVTTVAVKMVRATYSLHHMMALSRELKILVYLGEHPNIVNLLGACTQNISYGELFVIVEFCRYGNLRDYLFRHRSDFINQIDPVTEAIVDPNLRTDQSSGANTDYRCGSDNSSRCCSTDSTGINVSIDGRVSCEASVEPTLRSKYEGDYTDNILGPISTKDLLCWAWQIARGMKYLGVKRIVHGDLAARNILLADYKVVKICDFGLAKALYKDNHYRNNGQDPLPLKWAAIESIRDRTFSVQSDIWSFGIVLWELFTLGETPYPGIDPAFVYMKLLDGYRMDQPKNSPKKIYRVMMNCWRAEPANRPSFAEIEVIINELLNDSVTTLQYYLDFNHQYTEVNAELFQIGMKNNLTTNISQREIGSCLKDLEKVKSSNEQADESSESSDSS